MKPAKNHPIIYTSYFLMVAAVVKPNVKSSILAVVVSAVTKMGNKNISDSSLKLVLFTSCFDCNHDCPSNEIQAFANQLYCFVIHSDILLAIIFVVFCFQGTFTSIFVESIEDSFCNFEQCFDEVGA